MADNVADVNLLSGDSPFVLYNNWTAEQGKKLPRHATRATPSAGRGTGRALASSPSLEGVPGLPGGVVRHKKQLLFHKSLAKARFVFGGNRTGKSVCGAVETIWYATGTHPFVMTTPSLLRNATPSKEGEHADAEQVRPDERSEERLGRKSETPALSKCLRKQTEAKPDVSISGWIVSLTRQVQRDVAQAKILEYLPKEWIIKTVMTSGSADSPEYGVIDFIIVKNAFGTTSKIGFKNCEQGRERFQGAALDFVWFDEEPPEDIFDECILRLLDRGGVYWTTMTPLKGRSWVYDRIYLNRESNPDLECFTMSWDDNPYLLPEEKAYLEANLSPEVLESRKYGRFFDSSGLVFPEFVSENIVEPFNTADAAVKYISIDPGYRNPTAVVWIAVYGDRIFAVSDYEVACKTVTEHSAAIKTRTEELGWDLGKVRVLIDSAANQKTSACDVSTAEQYAYCGIKCDTGVTKNVMAGIMKMKSLFKKDLFVFRNCLNVIRELRGYLWGDGEQPDKINDHTADALRYAVMDIERGVPKPPLGFLGLGKKKMIKQLKFEYNK